MPKLWHCQTEPSAALTHVAGQGESPSVIECCRATPSLMVTKFPRPKDYLELNPSLPGWHLFVRNLQERERNNLPIF